MCHRQLCFLALIIFFLFNGNGCGKQRVALVPVTGKVLYQGKPLQAGAIMFHPENGPIAYAAIQHDGTFNLMTYSNGDGAVLGKHHVRVICTQPRTQEKEGGLMDDMVGPGPSLIPEKYSQLHSSGLSAEVLPATPPVVFDLN